MSPSYTFVQTKAEWDAALAAAGDKPVVVDFFAEWCGPCKMIAPLFEKLAEQNSDSIAFIKVDVDAAEAVAAECEISAMPTFKVFKNGQCVETMVGANPANLEKLIKSYQGAK